MRKINAYAILIVLLAVHTLLTSCDVHQWPKAPETVLFHLKLNYNTHMTRWEHFYDGENVIEQSVGPDTVSMREYGQMRYIVRAYPISEKNRTLQEYVKEFVFTRDIANGYNYATTLELPAGNYNIMVWSDMVQSSSITPFYNATNFAEIELQGTHTGNNEWRDAFRGNGNITLVSDIMERLPDTLSLTMQRPMAKYEFITTDIVDFIKKEITRAEAKSKAEGKDPVETKVDLDDYRVLFNYVGFMPDTYSMFTDKPVDSSTGISFKSKLNILSETEASLGFDYVMMNGSESAVTLQIVIYDKEDTQLSVSDPIKVPVKRNRHTIIKGMLLMSEAQGGVTINPEYEGDHNLVFP